MHAPRLREKIYMNDVGRMKTKQEGNRHEKAAILNCAAVKKQVETN